MSRMKAVLVFVAALVFAAAPLVTRGFRGFDPAAFPVPTIDPPLQPAPYAFAIWGLIYLWLIAHAGVGLFARDEDVAWDATRWPLFVSLGLGASWLAVARVEPVLATVQIWVMLGTALMALHRAPRVPDRWLLLAPLAVYAGWLTAAAPVALATVLIGHAVAPPLPASTMMLGLALAIGLAVQLRLDRAPEYALTLIWALVGIAVGNLPEGSIPMAALAVAGIAAMGWALARIAR